MARQNICGFETQDTFEYTAFGTAAIQTSVFNSGAAALRCNPTGALTGGAQFGGLDASGATVAMNAADVYARCYFRYATKPAANSEELLQVLNSSNQTKLALRLNSSGQLEAYDATGTTQIGSTGSTVLVSGTWYRIEVYCSKGTSGSFEIRLNGATEISGTGNLRTNNTAYVAFGKRVNRNSQDIDFYFDDIAIDDVTWIGESKILLLLPNGNATYTSWTNDYTSVDEVPPNTSDYIVSTLSIGDAETVNVQNCATVGISGTIKCVKAMRVVARDGASNGALRLRARSGSTDSDTTSDFATTSAYQLAARILETDPATSAAWTTTGVDGLEIGVIERSAANRSRCTAMYAAVEFVPSAAGVYHPFSSPLIRPVSNNPTALIRSAQL